MICQKYKRRIYYFYVLNALAVAIGAVGSEFYISANGISIWDLDYRFGQIFGILLNIIFTMLAGMGPNRLFGTLYFVIYSLSIGITGIFALLNGNMIDIIVALFQSLIFLGAMLILRKLRQFMELR